jgi:hypothetical protein
MTRQWVEGRGSPQVTECSKPMSKPDGHHTDPAWGAIAKNSNKSRKEAEALLVSVSII